MRLSCGQNRLIGRSGEAQTRGLRIPNAARYQLRYTPIVIKLWSCKWSNLWSNTFLTAIFCFPYHPKIARLKGFRRLAPINVRNAVYAPKCRALPVEPHPDIHFSAIISRWGRKSKIFLSVVIPVVKAAFVLLSAIGENPANAGVARLCGVSPHPIPDTTTALPKQARYQLRYTRLLSFLSGWAYSPKPGAIPTALHPDTVFTLHRKSVFDSPNSILDFGRKVNRPVAYPARIAYNKNITQYIKERAL